MSEDLADCGTRRRRPVDAGARRDKAAVLGARQMVTQQVPFSGLVESF